MTVNVYINTFLWFLRQNKNHKKDGGVENM